MSEERKEGAEQETPNTQAPGASPQPPRETEAAPAKKRSRAVRIGVALLVLVVLGAGGWAFFNVPSFHVLLHIHPGDNAATAVHGVSAKYTCGMHPFIISDKPGKCPICGMTLTRIEDADAAAAPGAATAAGRPAGTGGPAKVERKLLFYRHPMKPGVTSPVPAKDEMGMDYVPVYSDEVGGESGGSAVQGYSTVKVGSERLRLAGVQTAPAAREKIRRSVRAVGNVVPDETRIRHVHTKIDGWIEKLHTNFTGQLVTKGQPLLEIYSPELVSTQREYLLALSAVDRMKDASFEDARAMSSSLAEAARMRLERFDVPRSFVSDLERTGKVRRTVTLNAPISGYVTAKGVFEGMRIMPGMELFVVTDLSRIWIEADLYEYEARAVRLGQEATLSPEFDPGFRLKGKVSFIYPTLSPESRTLKVRFEFPNPGLRLKPQMYADVSLDLAAATGVVIPDSALIETGLRQIVFVDLGGGRFEPREVKVGIRGDGKAQVLSGVKEGERVAVRANFLLDSESRLKAALTGMLGGGTAAPQPQGQAPSKGHAGHGGGQ